MNHRLADILRTLLPGDADWPDAGFLADAVAGDLADVPDVLTIVQAALPADFTAGDEVALQAVEAAHPAAFERLTTAAYIAYYTDPGVRQVVERLTGYAARPPQPLGYDLPPFDEALLEVQKRRAPFWRDPG